ncbi:NAD(P)/FAD-dependent oxidoreductase [Pseudozobellia thermophila]|uniref:Glycine/D-amino acid oxidase n=1 Tax=Pseudozobellia thermophila TaxID=192903 RepID=A0A1M6B906_9FLAO|nr:FAD-dependent oxidoreductase [Pseudozobellia thermophila]SHI45220.1 Glycine/D-amino acid oxidase [Pseudozobellia thermophila]
MNLSYWEYNTWLSNVDFTIVGSGITGLSCALHLKKRFPKAKIIVLEKGTFPQGASTKNAGFACFGSISEILDDLRHHTEEEVRELVKKRWEGIRLLRRSLGDASIDYQRHGGHELFPRGNSVTYELCLNKLDYVNGLLHPVFKANAFSVRPNSYRFKQVGENYISHAYEGQIDTGKMMMALLGRVQKAGVTILNSVDVEAFDDHVHFVAVKTDRFEFKTKKLILATNGFAGRLLNEEVRPARAQVLLTKPIKGLHVKGTFHFDKGFYYFRNVHDRLLFGGGRNLDFKAEETTAFGQTERVQARLEQLLKEMILPGLPFEIERRWSGIMGMGDQKRPLVKQLSDGVFCGVRLGGMGIAIGSQVGKETADLI